ncbi:hypothetical protein [Candidatus Kuenenia stuttgartiensis]|uniref:hypothetical protein n=1 Tax=Kuenenia stuttgartiensis TaxID=174633 RepID=UPI00146BC6BD|nr:hypothetical protein [Candidatus Kuenenia stuttgartiensis]
MCFVLRIFINVKTIFICSSKYVLPVEALHNVIENQNTAAGLSAVENYSDYERKGGRWGNKHRHQTLR